MRPPNSILNLWGVIVTLIAGALGPISIAIVLHRELSAAPIDVSVGILTVGLASSVVCAAVLLVSVLRAPRR